jgi:hypothetical protein
MSMYSSKIFNNTNINSKTNINSITNINIKINIIKLVKSMDKTFKNFCITMENNTVYNYINKLLKYNVHYDFLTKYGIECMNEYISMNFDIYKNKQIEKALKLVRKNMFFKNKTTMNTIFYKLFNSIYNVTCIDPQLTPLHLKSCIELSNYKILLIDNEYNSIMEKIEKLIYKIINNNIDNSNIII